MKLIPKSIPLAILDILLVLVDMGFMAMLTVTDIVPTLYSVIILIVVIVLTLVIFKLLTCRKERTKQRKAGTVIAIIMMVILGIGTYYLFTTYAMFNKMSDEDKQKEDFYVVALKDGSYKDINDVDGEKVYIHKNASKTYDEAKERLQDEVNVEYVQTDTFMELKNVLIDKDDKEHDELIFLSGSNYEMICETFDGFEKRTRVIYTVSVDITNRDIAKRIDVTEDPFNVYISGIDTYGGISKVSRSDVNMLMTVNPKTKKILLTSIPRDMYVTLHSYGELDKLTHSGIYGIDETIGTVEDWLGIDINYYVRVNFTSVEDIVDAIGGIDVESTRSFSSGGYSYTEGINHLNGKEALQFARERKSFEAGDNERIKNQQRVLKGIIGKITGSPAILTGYTRILNTVGDEMQTNMANRDISALVRMQLEDIGGWDIESISIKGAGTMASTYSMGSRQLYVAIPDEESVRAAQDAINGVMLAVE